MSRLTDKPMARAANHLAAGRFPQAIGAYRAVLGIDPGEYQAHVGIAEAEAARGNLEGAMEGLLAAAEAYGEDENYIAALALFGHALGMDPTRLELHLDVAIYESAAGHHAAAIERCEALAEMYVRAGRRDESEEIFRFLASWEPGEVSREHSVPLKVALQASSPIVVAATQSDSQWPASEPLPAGMVPPQQDAGGDPYGAPPTASEPPVQRSSGTAPQQPITPAPGMGMDPVQRSSGTAPQQPLPGSDFSADQATAHLGPTAPPPEPFSPDQLQQAAIPQAMPPQTTAQQFGAPPPGGPTGFEAPAAEPPATPVPEPAPQAEVQPMLQPPQPMPEPAPQPVAHQATPQPTPQPVAHQATPQPVAHQATPQPVAQQATPQPVAQQATPQPVAHQATPQPVAHQATPQPVAPQEQPMAHGTPVPAEPMPVARSRSTEPQSPIAPPPDSAPTALPAEPASAPQPVAATVTARADVGQEEPAPAPAASPAYDEAKFAPSALAYDDDSIIDEETFSEVPTEAKARAVGHEVQPPVDPTPAPIAEPAPVPAPEPTPAPVAEPLPEPIEEVDSEQFDSEQIDSEPILEVEPDKPGDPWAEWANDPRAEPGGTVVFQVPDGFFDRVDKTVVAPAPDLDSLAATPAPKPEPRPEPKPEPRPEPKLAKPIVSGVPATTTQPPPAEPEKPATPSSFSRPAAPPLSRSATQQPNSATPSYSTRTSAKSSNRADKAPRGATGRYSTLSSGGDKSPRAKTGSRPSVKTGAHKPLGTSTKPRPTTTGASGSIGSSSTPSSKPASSSSTSSRPRTGSHRPVSAAQAKTIKRGSSLVDRLRKRAGLDESGRGVAKPKPRPKKSAAPEPTQDDTANKPDDDKATGRAKTVKKVKSRDDAPDIPNPPLDSMATTVHPRSKKIDDGPEEVTVRKLATEGAPVEDDQATQIFQSNNPDDQATNAG